MCVLSKLASPLSAPLSTPPKPLRPRISSLLPPKKHLPALLPAPRCPRVPEAQTRLTQCKQSRPAPSRIRETAGARQRQRPRWAQVDAHGQGRPRSCWEHAEWRAPLQPGKGTCSRVYGIQVPSWGPLLQGAPPLRPSGGVGCVCRYSLFSGSGLRTVQAALDT